MFWTGAVGIEKEMITVLISGRNEDDAVDKTPAIAGTWQTQVQLSE